MAWTQLDQWEQGFQVFVSSKNLNIEYLSSFPAGMANKPFKIRHESWVSKKKFLLLHTFYQCLKSKETAVAFSNPHRKCAHEHTLHCTRAGAVSGHGNVLVASLLLAAPLGPRFLDDQMGKWMAGVAGDHPCSLTRTPCHLLPLSVAWPSGLASNQRNVVKVMGQHSSDQITKDRDF